MKLFSLSSIVLLIALAIPLTIPHANAATGLVCIADPSVNPASCSASPASFSGVVGSNVTVAVNIQGSDTVNGFDISTLVDSSVLQPVNILVANSIIHDPKIILAQTVDPNSGIARMAMVALGYNVPGPVTGNLFTIVYRVLASNRGTGIVFQTGCSNTSVPNTCVTVTSPSADSEIVQNGSLIGPVTPNFSLSTMQTSQNVPAGSSTFTRIIVNSINGFTGTVNLSTSVPPVCSGCPTWSIVPTSVSLASGGAAFANVTFHTTSNTPPATYTVIVNGTSGSLAHSLSLSYTVTAPPNFSISANPSSQNVNAGASATSSIILTSLNGFSGTVNLATSPQLTCPNCPGWSVNPTSVTLSSGGTASSTLTFTSFVGGPTGTFNVNVTGTSGSLSHSTVVSFTIILVPTFSISANPTSLSIIKGQSASSAINVTSLNGFSGTVTLSATISPSIRKAPALSISPTSVTLVGGGTATATLLVSTNGGTQEGTYNITITATSGSITKTTTVTVTVLPRH